MRADSSAEALRNTMRLRNSMTSLVRASMIRTPDALPVRGS